MVSNFVIDKQERKFGKSSPVVTVVHYADPWCWWSWGLEPVLARLKEVYEDQLEVVYRMGGMAETKEAWLRGTGVSEHSLKGWIEDSIEFSRNPVDPDYFTLSGFDSSTPAALAVIAANQQNPELGNRFFRRLLESFQLEARPANFDTIRDAAIAVGLDADHLLEFATSLEARTVFAEQVASMRRAHVNFLSLVIQANGESEVLGESFNAADYEEVIDRLAPGLFKRQPADILEYMEKAQGAFVSAKEISEVFRIPLESAGAKLIRLAEHGAVRESTTGVPDLWQYGSLPADDFNEEIIRASHVLPAEWEVNLGGLKTVVKSAVQSLYTQVAENPGAQFHFPPGITSALHVGYPMEELNRIPFSAVESFAGVGFPFSANAIERGDRVLDVGSGSGTDALLSAIRAGEFGRVIGLDVTPAMIEKAKNNVELAGLTNVEFLEGEATHIPVEDGAVDVVTSNGVLNLVVDKATAFAEIFRVVRPGGKLQIADIVSETSVGAVCGINPQLWADCVGGAATKQEFLRLLDEAGFLDVEILDTRDYFEISESETTRGLTRNFGVSSIVVQASKPL